MRAMEYSKGGVDEATFVSQIVPIMKEDVEKTLQEQQADPKKAIMDQIKMMQEMGYSLPGGNDVFEAMVSQKMDEFDLPKVFVGVLQRSTGRSEEYLPDLVREIFKFLDLDDSGTISSEEIKLLKALLDALLNLGQRAVQDFSSGEAKPTEGSTEDHAIALATTIFDVVDRDHSGKLSLVELVQFGQKVLAFLLGFIKVYSHVIIECVFDELVKALLEVGWKSQNLTEVPKEQLMMLIQMAPMIPMMLGVQ